MTVCYVIVITNYPWNGLRWRRKKKRECDDKLSAFLKEIRQLMPEECCLH